MDWIKEHLPELVGLVLGLLLALGVINLPEGYDLEQVVAIISGFLVLLLSWLFGSGVRQLRRNRLK